jgi:hypothetical protein
MRPAANSRLPSPQKRLARCARPPTRVLQPSRPTQFYPLPAWHCPDWRHTSSRLGDGPWPTTCLIRHPYLDRVVTAVRHGPDDHLEHGPAISRAAPAATAAVAAQPPPTAVPVPVPGSVTACEPRWKKQQRCYAHSIRSRRRRRRRGEGWRRRRCRRRGECAELQEVRRPFTTRRDEVGLELELCGDDKDLS